jgi:hypothetical protein
MNTTSHSATIERMRLQRNVPTIENRDTWSPRLEPWAHVEPTSIDPRLLAIEAEIGERLELDDPVELRALLEDLQTLCYRCSYHVHAALIDYIRKQDAPARRGASGRRRGRPKGKVNFAARQFGLGAGQIVLEHTGRRPTRRVCAFTGKAYGPYREFLALIVGALTDAPWMCHGDRFPDIEYLLRESVTALTAAHQATEEYRQRGLLDEASWLRDDAA